MIVSKDTRKDYMMKTCKLILKISEDFKAYYCQGEFPILKVDIEDRTFEVNLKEDSEEEAMKYLKILAATKPHMDMATYKRMLETLLNNNMASPYHQEFSRQQKNLNYFSTLKEPSQEVLKSMTEEDVVAFHYISMPQPGTMDIQTVFGYVDGILTLQIESGPTLAPNDLERSFKAFQHYVWHDLKFQNWKRDYEPKNYVIIDGHHYDIILELKGGYAVKIHGENAYHRKFRTLLNYVEGLI
jgi:hypothetical protein